MYHYHYNSLHIHTPPPALWASQDPNFLLLHFHGHVNSHNYWEQALCSKNGEYRGGPWNWLQPAPHIKEHFVFPAHNARTTCSTARNSGSITCFLSSGPSEPSPAPSRGDLDEVWRSICQNRAQAMFQHASNRLHAQSLGANECFKWIEMDLNGSNPAVWPWPRCPESRRCLSLPWLVPTNRGIRGKFVSLDNLLEWNTGRI